jgi:hypothetical protein
MRSRVKGQATTIPWKYEGLALYWKTYAEFRVFALANGFSKVNCSPDRKDSKLGYVPGNVRFVPIKKNCNVGGRSRCGHDDVRGPEPPEDN